MIDINKEAEEYSSYNNPNIPLKFGTHDYNETHKETFIAGYNSKATQAKILQAQIDVLEKQHYFGGTNAMIYKLQQQLSQLENKK
jgi:hypothetical protein